MSSSLARGIGQGAAQAGVGVLANVLGLGKSRSRGPSMSSSLARGIGQGAAQAGVGVLANVLGLGKKHDGRSERAAMVRQVMHERGVPLAQASSIVKNEGLYKGGRVFYRCNNGNPNGRC
jgi:hypothetical protein